MKWLLLGEDLWGYVDGSEVKPENDGADSIVRKWRKGYQKALYFIGTSIESELQVHIDNIENAKEAWDVIKNQFQRASLMQKIRLRKQYYQLEFHYGGDIHIHVRKLCELHSEMKELGEPIDDKELAMTLLASLPFDRYQSQIVALDVAGVDNLSFNNVKALLLNEADHLADSNADSQRAVAKDCRIPKKREKNVSHDPNYSRINAQVAQISEDQTEEDAGFALTVTSKYCKMDGIWIIDSGASQHMVSDQNLLQDFHVYEKPHEMKLAGNCDLIYAVGEGNIKKIKFECGEMLVDLMNVLYVPDLGDNLLSVHSMTMHGANVIFSKGVCKISARGKILGIGQKHERLFGIKVVFPDHVCVAQVKPLDDYSLELWHERMGHINKDSISKLQKVVEGISTIKKVNHCLSCAKGKQQRKPFNSRSSHSEDILDIVHIDVMGPFEIESIGGLITYAHLLMTSQDMHLCT